jgi:hypothetical protein
MKRNLLISLIALVFCSSLLASPKPPLIIDHSMTSVSTVPAMWIAKAQKDLNIFYGHTSHGSQLITGMGMLSARAKSIYQFGSDTILPIIEKGDMDLGNPSFEAWEQETRTQLNQPDSKINLVMWSWCGEASWASDENINTYLSLMNQLETDFPNVKFVYFTGHLDGTGTAGTLNKNNDRIRDYCRQNGKILFDFADIESYGPDGRNYLELNGTDACNYNIGDQTGNWAQEWCAAHPEDCTDCSESISCAHSECLNCLRKGQATWNGFARIAGWDGMITRIEEDTAESEGVMLFQNYPNPADIETQFRFYLPDDRAVTIEIYNSVGDKMMTPIENRLYLKGEHDTERISVKELPSGHYEYLLKAGSVRISKTMIIIR